MIILIILGGIALSIVIFFFALVILGSSTKHSNSVSKVRLEFPEKVKLKEKVTIKVFIQNTSQQVINVSSIVVKHGILKKLEVLDFNSKFQQRLYNYNKTELEAHEELRRIEYQFKYQLTISPLKEVCVELQCRAIKSGNCRGDINVAVNGFVHGDHAVRIEII